VSANLHELYEQAILDHNRRPRNFRAIAGAPNAEGHNRLCGDRVIVYVRVADDVVIDAGFQGSGCAIAMASASLMTEAVKGESVPEVRALFDRLQRMLETAPGGPVDQLGALTALAGVRQFPVRVKCATLPWQALQDALDGITS
jgi:nitrogen fixation NifU-like protein